MLGVAWDAMKFGTASPANSCGSGGRGAVTVTSGNVAADLLATVWPLDDALAFADQAIEHMASVDYAIARSKGRT